MDEFYLCWNWTQVILYLDLLMLLIENFVKFCMKEVFKCRERRMIRWDEEWTKAQAWGCPCHPKNYPRSTSVKAWGCPRIPSSSTNYQVLFQCAIFLLLHIICAVLGASLFLFLVFLCFVCCNKWLDPIIHVLEKTHSVLIAWNTLVFTLIVPRVFQFF